jgi:RNA polymerase sigma-70 factor (ECF subfamily)
MKGPATDMHDSQTDLWVTQAAAGDPEGLRHLFQRHRGRLRRMIAVRLDRRIDPRLDPSDIVQEALVEAAARMKEYARDRKISFYPWLRRIAWQRLVKAHRHHVAAQRRSVAREENRVAALPDDSLELLAGRLLANEPSPSEQMIHAEMQHRVRTALEGLRATDREVLVLRYLEQLSMAEIAEVTEITETTARQRHARALGRLQQALGEPPVK